MYVREVSFYCKNILRHGYVLPTLLRIKIRRNIIKKDLVCNMGGVIKLKD